jgi:nicotinamide mononucleotide (NMN) deamidase PncC
LVVGHAFAMPVAHQRETAGETGHGVARLFDAPVALATTGAAGPTPLDGAKPGTVVVGCFLDGTVHTALHHFDGSPDDVCGDAAAAALRDLEDLLHRHRVAEAPGLG